MNPAPQPAAADGALQAFAFCYPLYEMARMRAATSPRRLPQHGFADATPQGPLRWCNALTHRRELLTAGGSRVVTPNNDTLYSNAWLDLDAGPLVIDVPATAGRYYVLGLLDMFTNPFAHLGSRLHGTEAGAFLVSGPGWQGDVPAAFRGNGRHVRSATRWAWMIGRWAVQGEEDLPAVHALQDALQLRPLAAWLQGAPGEPQRFNPGCDPALPLSPEHFAEQVNRVLAEQPPLAQDEAAWRHVAEAGLGPQAALEARAGAPAQLAGALPQGMARLQAGQGAEVIDGWTMPPLLGESFGTDYWRRAEVALKYIGALESREAHYPMAFADAQGQALSGRHRYRLHFPAGQLPPVDGFWSITLYGRHDFMFVANPIGRYAIGDRTAGLHRGADGSLTLHVQHEAPTEPQALANWLPAPPGEFYLCLRAYLPRPPLLNGRYRLPGVQRLTHSNP